MEDTKTEVLEQYDFQVNNSYRGRDARILDTDQGLLSLREYSGSQRKLQFQDSLLEHLRGEGFLADFIVKNKEGGLTSKDREERPFVVRAWYEGKECSLREEAQVKKAVEYLAKLHRCCRGITLPEGVEAADFVQDVSGILERHNREMRKTRSYVRSRRGKTDFEAAFLQCYPEFYEKGARAAEALAQSAYGNLYARAVQEGADAQDAFDADLAGYHVPVNADVRDIEATWIEEDDPHLNPMGSKGIGEIGITGAAAAIVNAVHAATGVRVRRLPVHIEDLL